MQVINNLTNGSNQTPLSSAERNAMAQFEASDRGGAAVWRPWVSGNGTSPHCVVVARKIGRFAIFFLPGKYGMEGDNWYRRDADGRDIEVADPLETVWEAGMAARDEIHRDYNFGGFVVPVAVFTDMDPDETILEERGSPGVKVLWGLDDLVERVIRQLPEDKRKSDLNSKYVEKDVRALTRGPSPEGGAAPEEVQVDLESGLLNLNKPKSVIVNVSSGARVTININGSAVDGDAFPPFTATGQ